jgi:predicted RNA methylase
MDDVSLLRALHRPGTIVDVGAHDGALTVPLAGLPGARVVAVESLPSAFARLEAAVAGLPVLTVEIQERHRAGSTVAVPAFLAGLGYRGFYWLEGAWRGIETFDLA